LTVSCCCHCHRSLRHRVAHRQTQP
jgi:hypothetical protein